MSAIAGVTYLVRDYDEAIAFFVRQLGFVVAADADMGGGRRWVVVEPPGGRGARLVLGRAVGADQIATLGKQAGGRAFLFLETDDFARDHAATLAAGVVFREPPRHEAYGIVAVFEDLYGQPWDLIEPRP
jgi:catechol 2,3-dioxygenase-like lactoylglutathione lyase family enzyme